MRKFLHLEMPPLEANRELQKTFCKLSQKCVEKDGCKSCLYSEDNIKVFQMRFKDLEK
ncbi:MAG: hypothetical protein HYU67_04510 [Flavobacteriia bacterium]|nr:hypothetical protein [Flavobacteriia bacterium]